MVPGRASSSPKSRARVRRTIASAVPSLARQAITPTARSLNGPIGPHRRWAWTDGPTKGMTHEHTFHEDGTVEWRDANAAPKTSTPTQT